MDLPLRCNTLKCRTPLSHDAVVTTCSHIFCLRCANTSGLASAPSSAARLCPACKAPLPHPDDAVRTSLAPSEDYKTSVLGGLSPSVIMECAGRGLAFYTYQAAQEVVYQEFAARNLQEKNHGLNDEMDRLVQQANLEISSLRGKNAALHAEKTELEAKNHELATAFRDKCRKLRELEKLYTAMKQRQDAAAVVKEAEQMARSMDVRREERVRFSPGRVVEHRQDAFHESVRSHSRSSANSAEHMARNQHTHWQNQPEVFRHGVVPPSRTAPVSHMPATPSGHRIRLDENLAPGHVMMAPSSVVRQPAAPQRQPLMGLDPNIYAGDSVNGVHGRVPGSRLADRMEESSLGRARRGRQVGFISCSIGDM